MNKDEHNKVDETPKNEPTYSVDDIILTWCDIPITGFSEAQLAAMRPKPKRRWPIAPIPQWPRKRS